MTLGGRSDRRRRTRAKEPRPWVQIRATVRSVDAVSILTGAPENDSVSADPGLTAAGSLERRLDR